MKVKKIPNRTQSNLSVVNASVFDKGITNQFLMSGTQSLETMKVSTTDPNELKLPQLRRILDLSLVQEGRSDSSLSEMPALRRIPNFDYDNNTNNTINVSINQSIINCNDTESDVNTSHNLLDKIPIPDEESINNLMQELGIENLINSNKTEVNDSSFSTNIPLSPVNNDSFNLVQNQTILNLNENLNQTMNKVCLDLSDNSNSPKNSGLIKAIRSEVPNISSEEFVFPLNKNRNTQQIESQTNVSQETPKKKNRSEKLIKIKPLNYCARNYRVIGLSRHSSRLKNNEEVSDNPYDHIENASWSEIDGTQYNCVVSKWRSEDKQMTEEKRKEILSKVNEMKFRKSIFNDDKNVFYAWSAFKEECNQTDGLKCLMRLDYGAVKNSRFNGECITKLFLLSGQSLLNAENGKQKKSLETGQEIKIPPHTRYQLENKNVEPCYFYVHVTRSQPNLV